MLPLIKHFPHPLRPLPIALAVLVFPMVSAPLTAADPPQAPQAPVRKTVPEWHLSPEQKEQVRAADERSAQIDAEIKRLPRSTWAGTYCRLHITGVSLQIAPQSGFVYEQGSCVAPPSQVMGSVTVMPMKGMSTGVLRLCSDGGGSVPKELIPVRWGARHYLVEPEDMKPFCSAVNSRSNDTLGLVREGDANKPVFGLPDVPAAFRHYLLPHPLTGKVTTVGPPLPTQWKDRFACNVTVNLGRADGVYKGMQLFAPDVRGGNRTLLGVISVTGSHRCRAFAWPNSQSGTFPKRGWVISSLSNHH